MNIFVVDRNPLIAAQSLCDRHVIKMILESAQMLNVAHRVLDGTGFFKMTHVNHPCTIWARTTPANYRWLYDHFKGLLYEYAYRYNGTHSYAQYEDLLSRPPVAMRNDMTLTPFYQAMPAQYKHADPVIAYRSYYCHEKLGFTKYTHRAPPHWLVSHADVARLPLWCRPSKISEWTNVSAIYTEEKAS
jgi:Pyrimidine dimer DNA glycosylase